MPTPPNARSVKISDDERGGWSSHRPRRGGGPERPADVSVRGRVLSPSDTLRYSPGSLVVIVSASPEARETLLARVLETQSTVFGLDKVRALVAGRVPADQEEEQAAQLLDKAVAKRLENGESVVLAAGTLDPEERDRYVRMAHRFRRPRHLILLEAARDQVADEDRAALNDLRRRLDAGELGKEGFQTSLRLGAPSTSEPKRRFSSPPPQDD